MASTHLLLPVVFHLFIADTSCVTDTCRFDGGFFSLPFAPISPQVQNGKVDQDFVFYDDPDARCEKLPELTHCGVCGNCSTLEDIEYYNSSATANSLKETGIKCGLVGFWSGGDAEKVAECFEERTELTSGCIDPWVENVLCDLEHCKWTCLWERVFGEPETEEGKLTPCLQCDEFWCGTDFMRDAGATRRRVGILTDIERYPDQVCTNVTINGVQVGFVPE